MKTIKQQSGYIMLTALVVGVVLSILGTIGVQVLINNARFAKFEERQSKALNVAEAGINYYLWHLSHNSTDYKDGGTTPATAPYGPYVHNYYDNDGNYVGKYTLTITPPASGSTITTVKSVGQVPLMAGTRTVLAQIGQPSFANYALLTNTEVWFGNTESSSGPVQSNVGVHFDGTNNGPVYSASATYKPTSQFGGNGTTKNGVWGIGGPTSQWQFPVPTISFSALTANLSTLQTQAGLGGVTLPTSTGLGYYLLLKADGTIDVYKVTNETSTTLTKTFLYNKTAPGNGIFFVNDDVWVEGTNFPGRISIVSAILPSNAGTNTSIKVVGNLTYKAKDGSVAIGLIAQKNIQVANYAPSTIEIDGALLGQNGQVFVDQTAPVKTSLTFYGAIASYSTWTWNWVNGSNQITAGYTTTATNFDSNLIYAPPPQYPTTGNYSILNWREQLYNP
jgi:type II secretory pathway pseudopilin PulG